MSMFSAVDLIRDSLLNYSRETFFASDNNHNLPRLVLKINLVPTCISREMNKSPADINKD